MSGALSKAWWLLALSGILDAMHAAINLLMMNLPLIFRSFGSPSVAVRDMGLLALSAGACAIDAALWSAGKIIPGSCRFTASRLRLLGRFHFPH